MGSSLSSWFLSGFVLLGYELVEPATDISNSCKRADDNKEPVDGLVPWEDEDAADEFIYWMLDRTLARVLILNLYFYYCASLL